MFKLRYNFLYISCIFGFGCFSNIMLNYLLLLQLSLFNKSVDCLSLKASWFLFLAIVCVDTTVPELFWFERDDAVPEFDVMWRQSLKFHET